MLNNSDICMSLSCFKFIFSLIKLNLGLNLNLKNQNKFWQKKVKIYFANCIRNIH